MKIKDLSIADLKSAYDFVVMDLGELQEIAKAENVFIEDVPAYKEVKNVECRLWDELLNRTRFLE